jgi:uncharacterized membrane protein YgcG
VLSLVAPPLVALVVLPVEVTLPVVADCWLVFVMVTTLVLVELVVVVLVQVTVLAEPGPVWVMVVPAGQGEVEGLGLAVATVSLVPTRLALFVVMLAWVVPTPKADSVSPSTMRRRVRTPSSPRRWAATGGRRAWAGGDGGPTGGSEGGTL